MMELSAMLFILVLLSSKILPVLSAVPGNIALFKPIETSSQHRKTKGRNAVDGYSTGTDVTDIFATASNDPDPYWRVDLQELYLVQTVEYIKRVDCCVAAVGIIEVRVGTSLENNGNSNQLCGEAVNMNTIERYTFHCELYGRYVNVRKSYPTELSINELIINQEPTTNIALGKPTKESSRFQVSVGGFRAVDGIPNEKNFLTKDGILPHWWMVDFEATKPVVKIFAVPRKARYRFRGDRMIITIGDSAVDNGKHNPRLGKIHDLSAVLSVVYSEPPMHGRYAYLESLKAEPINFYELEFYSESMPYIAERSNGRGRRNLVIYSNRTAVLPCEARGFPKPHVAWISNGIVLQNRTTDTDLVFTSKLAKGSSQTYECVATNIHGKDRYDVTVAVAGHYDMCLRPVEIKDSTRNMNSKLKSNEEAKTDVDTFDKTQVYKFFNPESALYMKLATSCPPRGSCQTDAPGWLSGTHPKPDDGLVRRTVCFHYDGNCCYKSVDINIMNCPGAFVYEILNTHDKTFKARYCFEDDINDEAFAPFKSLSLFFGAVGGADKGLANHVIAKEDGIQESSQCLLVCLMNKCRSFNFAQSEKLCEVSDATKNDFPLALTAKTGFRYYHPMKQPAILKGSI